MKPQYIINTILAILLVSSIIYQFLFANQVADKFQQQDTYNRKIVEVFEDTYTAIETTNRAVGATSSAND